jgi:hypothetical protein
LQAAAALREAAKASQPTRKPVRAASDRAVDSYLETALWSSTDDDGEPLDKNFDVSDFSSEDRQKAAKSLADFMSGMDKIPCPDGCSLSDKDIGHNFWLSRNEHGTGFFDLFDYKDKEATAYGKQLQKLAKSFGSSNVTVYMGDDGPELELVDG